MKTTSYALLFSVVLILSNCTTTSVVATGTASDVRNEALEQMTLVLRTQRDRTKKLNDLYWPIRKNNTDLCGEDSAYMSGFMFARISDFEREYREAARFRLGVTENPTVYFVTDNAPAQKADLRNGDVITSLDGESMGTGNRSNRRLTRLLSESTSAPYTLGILRNNESLTLNIQPELVCSYGIGLDPNDSLNAYADGNNIYITTGMYRFVENDQELQLVIAHELAHNSEGHLDKKLGNALFGAVFDIAAAVYGVNTQGAFAETTAQMFSQEFEREADYVALYMLSKTDVPIEEAGNFWRRMAAEYPSSIRGSFTASHPTSAERYVNIGAAVSEINQKVASGILLEPERRE